MSNDGKSNDFTVNWYPGHMTKTVRNIEKDLKMVDAVTEILDARIPFSSRNPDIGRLAQSKPKIMLLNKSDMADPESTKKWSNYFNDQGYTTLEIDCQSRRGIGGYIPALNRVLGEKIQSYRKKGMLNPVMRVMIVGIPNVGKSSFINCISKQSRAKTADRPGVTRGNQWFQISKGFEMLDTPGILWPRFEDPKVGERLALTGAIKDQIFDTELLSIRLLDLFKNIKPKMFSDRFRLTDEDYSLESYELLEKIGRKRGMLISGGEVDTVRASVMLLDEFRGAKYGRLTLELPYDDGLA